jgi:replicative DNA helicase
MSAKTRTLPQSNEAERALLGTILQDDILFDKSKKYLTSASMFYSSMHRRIWNIMTKLIHDEKGIDTVSVCSMITSNDKKIYTSLDSYYITGLLDDGIRSKCRSYAKIIAEKYYQRELIREANEIQTFCFDNSRKYEDIIKKVSNVTNNLQTISTGKDFDLKALIRSTNKSIEEPLDLIKYGYQGLNKLAGGMTRGEITVIAGRPGHGKTTFIINMAHKLLEQGHKVMVINREMNNIEMMKKLLVISSGNLSHSMLRSGKVDTTTQEEINKTLKEIEEKYEKNLIMFDDVFTLKDSTTLVEKFKPDIVIDDFIQLIRVDSRLEGRRFEIEEIMTEYKMLSKKINMVTILVSQLNRNIEQRVDPIPKMSDLAESGSIEQTAENIIFVYYDYKVRFEASEYGPDRNQLIAAKVRYGTSGSLTMGFNGDKCLFYENITHKPIIKDDTIQLPKQYSLKDTKDFFKIIGKELK